MKDYEKEALAKKEKQIQEEPQATTAPKSEVDSIIASAKTFKEGDELKEEPTEPWKPARILGVDQTFPGMRTRWVLKDADHLRKRLSEGWVVLKGDDNLPKTMIDGTPLDGTIQRRELILMGLPEKRAKAREEYHAKLGKDNLKQSVEDFKRDAQVGGGKFYGSVEVLK